MNGVLLMGRGLEAGRRLASVIGFSDRLQWIMNVNELIDLTSYFPT